MKTSVIRYRVADFLREHPPFDVIPLEELLAFSGIGRVVFQEDDIFLFRKGQTREPVLWILKQGRIELLDELPSGDLLRDMLGPGDLLGLSGQDAEAAYQLTARTATEVILYSFDRSAFETLVDRYPEARRFLSAYLSAAEQDIPRLRAPAVEARLLTEKEQLVWLNAPSPPADWLARRRLTCEAMLPEREAARLLARAQSEVMAVVASSGQPLGIITSNEFRDQAAMGRLTSEATAESLMKCHFPTALPNLRTADYLLKMLFGRSQSVVVTEDGSAESPVLGVVTAADLEIACGRNPILLQRQILGAKSVSELAYLWRRAEALLAESLVGPSVVEWLARMLSELRAALIECVVQIAGTEMAELGLCNPGTPHCWMLFDGAGRGELLTPIFEEIGVAYVDPPQGAEEVTEQYFSTLAQKVAENLRACVFQSGPAPAAPGPRRLCRSLSQWKEFYRRRIRDPIGSGIYLARGYFDFSVVCGEAFLGAELQQVISEELEANESFIAVLANDTIASMPPLTFFQGLVLETDGRMNQTLDAQKTTLNPITDGARVLSLADHAISPVNTLERLRQMSERLPHHAPTLTDAAEGWRIVCYHHSLAGIVKPGDQPVIYPSRLSRFEQRLLKTAFDATRRFVEFTSSFHSLTLPQ